MPSHLARSFLLCLAALTLTACGAQVVEERRDPELVTLEGALGNRFVPAGEETEMVARLRIGTLPIAGAHRPPINLALVIDTSGSMEGAPIADARRATALLLEELRDGDRLSVVVFHSETEVLLESIRIDGEHRDEVRERIETMRAQGTTDLSGGLRAGLEQVVRNFDPQGINRVVLLSDGVPNDAAGIEALATAAGERGVGITALGLGLDYDETLLAAVATQSGGRFHYVAESSAVASVFRDEVLRMSRAVAHNLVIELRPGPGVRIDAVVGQPVAAVGGRITLSLGDLAEGQTRDVIVRLRADGRRSGAMVEMMDAVLRFDDAIESAGSLERRVFMGARATMDDAEIAGGRDQDVERAAAQVMAAAVTIEAIRLARTGEVESAREILRQAALQAERAQVDVAAAERMRTLEATLPAFAAEASGSPMPMAEEYAYEDDAPGVASDSEARGSGGAGSSGGGERGSRARPAAEPARAVREAHGAAMEVLQGPL